MHTSLCLCFQFFFVYLFLFFGYMYLGVDFLGHMCYELNCVQDGSETLTPHPSLMATVLQEDQPPNLLWTVADPFIITGPAGAPWHITHSFTPSSRVSREAEQGPLASNRKMSLITSCAHVFKPVYPPFTSRAFLFASVAILKLNTSDAYFMVFVSYVIIINGQNQHVAYSSSISIFSLIIQPFIQLIFVFLEHQLCARTMLGLVTKPTHRPSSCGSQPWLYIMTT